MLSFRRQIFLGYILAAARSCSADEVPASFDASGELLAEMKKGAEISEMESPNFFKAIGIVAL